MLIACIISVCERSDPLTKREDNIDAGLFNVTGIMTLSPSSKFSVGIYEIEGENESNLKREM